jgi:hypothetical protein
MDFYIGITIAVGLLMTLRALHDFLDEQQVYHNMSKFPDGETSEEIKQSYEDSYKKVLALSYIVTALVVISGSPLGVVVRLFFAVFSLFITGYAFYQYMIGVTYHLTTIESDKL